MKTLGLVFFFVLMLGACASPYKSLTFHEFSGNEFKDILPFTVKIPKVLILFKPQRSSTSSVWLSPEDIKKIEKKTPREPSDSFFASKLSLSLNYNSQQDLFQASIAGKVKNSLVEMKNFFEKNGMNHVAITRHNIDEFPVLQLEMQGGNNTNIRRLYIATKISKNTIEISFIGKNSNKKADDKIWNNFVNSIIH